MTPLEEELLAALRELLELSEIMTSGRHFSADDLDRFFRSKARAKRVIVRTENDMRYYNDQNQIPLF